MLRHKQSSDIVVKAAPWRGRSSGKPRQGLLHAAGRVLPCAIGRSGLTARKMEGDGATPVGRFTFASAMFRGDRRARPTMHLPLRQIRPDDGWCDAPGDRNYNRFVRHPYPASAERLWRSDQLYDVIVIISHNGIPRVSGAGSAVFVHVAKPHYPPTEGCIALRPSHLEWLLRSLHRKRAIRISAS